MARSTKSASMEDPSSVGATPSESGCRGLRPVATTALMGLQVGTALAGRVGFGGLTVSGWCWW